MSTSTIILIIIVLIVGLGFAIFQQAVGAQIAQLFPQSYLQVGDKAHIYLDGKYNRTTTISAVLADRIVIYDRVGLPLTYRGRFYAIGIDYHDGSKVMYLADPKLLPFVRAAEFVRALFNTADCLENLEETADPVLQDQQKDSEEDEDGSRRS